MAYTVAPMRTNLGTLGTAGLVLAAALVLALPAVPAPASVLVDGIAAVVNGEVITLLDLERAGRFTLGQRLSTTPASEQERVRREVLGTTLEQLILNRIQAQRARQFGIQVSAAEVDAAIARIREENRMSEELLARLLQERGVTRAEYRRDIEDQIRLSQLVQHDVRAKITATDEEIAAWFAEHRHDWYRPEKVRIRHLLVPLPREPSADDLEQARARAAALFEQAKGGADFAALVRAQTPGATPETDPVSGEIARGELFPALEAAVFTQPAGGIAGPVQSPAGFHIVQIVAKIPAVEPKLEELRSSIEQKIVDRKTRERFDSWVKQIRSEAIVEIRY